MIRRAAARSSRALAEQQLHDPTEQVALQLSRVTTSAYRLLDPRQRPDPNQRTHIGRILPNVLSWAGQTTFRGQSVSHSRLSRARDRANAEGANQQRQPQTPISYQTAELDSPFSADSLSDAELMELMELDSTPLLEGQPAWTQSLHDGDLLDSSPIQRRFVRWRRRLKHPWSLLVMGGLCIGTVLGLMPLNSEDRSAVPRAESVDVIAPSVSNDLPSNGGASYPPKKSMAVAQVDASQIPPRNLDGGSSLSKALDVLVPHDQTLPTDASVGMNGETTDSSLDLLQPLDSDLSADKVDLHDAVASGLTASGKPDMSLIDSLMGNVFPESAGDLASDSSAPVRGVDVSARNELDPSQSMNADAIVGDAADKEASTLPDSSAAASVSAEFLPDPFAALAYNSGSKTSDRPTLEDLMLPTGNENEGTNELGGSENAEGDKFPVPEDLAVEAALVQLRMLIPRLSRSIPASDTLDVLAEVKQVRADLDPGTPDHWAACLAVTELQWRQGDVDEVLRQVSESTSMYSVDPRGPAAAAFANAAASELAPSDQSHLVKVGVVFADELMTSEMADLARSIIHATTPLAESFQDRETIEVVHQYETTIDQVERLSETARRAISAEGQLIDPNSKGIMGRYYCLLLRRWDEGLIWLTSASDARIAGVARQELELSSDASASDLSGVAERWLAASERSAGLTADSMKLHALTLLRRASAKATALERLRVDDEIEQVTDSLSESLQVIALRDAFETASHGKTSKTRSPSGAGQPNPKQSESGPLFEDGLSGAIQVDGNDLGIRLNYELDVPVKQSLIDQIGEHLQLELQQLSMEFAGEIELDQTTKVRVTIAPVQQGVVQKVRVNEHLVDIEPDTGIADVTLPAGQQKITWDVEVQGGLEQIYLRLQNAESGERLSVTPQEDFGQTKLTVGIQRGN